MTTHHGVNQLDSVVFRRVVTGCDHDPNGRIALLGTESCNETNCVDNMIEKRAVFPTLVSLRIL
jgi:hypothetical protein